MSFPSTFSDLQNEVINRVRLDATADLQKAKDWINQAYVDICVDTEAVQDVADVALSVGTYVYTTDAAVLRIKTAWITRADGSETRALQQVSPEQIVDWRQSNGTPTGDGVVTHYAMMGYNQLVVWPTPTAADELSLFYVGLPTALSDATDVPVIQEPYVTECLVNGACFKAALFLGDPNWEIYKKLFEEARARFRGHLNRKRGTSVLQFRTPDVAVTPTDLSADVRGWNGA